MMKWLAASDTDLPNDLVRLDFPVQDCETDCGKDEQRCPRAPQWRLQQLYFSDYVVVEVSDLNAAGNAIESAEQACGYVAHEGKQADYVCPPRLENEVDDASKHRRDKHQTQHRATRDNAPLQQR